jgi:hypothetical protein
MNSIKCAECGLVNFASATECKRCHLKLQAPETISAAVPVVNETVENDEVLSEPSKDDQPQVVLAPLPEYFDAEPAPFTGWVILFTVYLGFCILAFMFQLKVFFDFMGSSRYQLATDPGGITSFYIPYLEPMLYAELILKSVELLAALGLMLLIPGKSWTFLRWVRIYLFATVLIEIAEIVGGLSLRASFAARELVTKPTQLSEIELGFGLLSAGAFIMISLVWAAYFEKSERVKKIFIN